MHDGAHRLARSKAAHLHLKRKKEEEIKKKNGATVYPRAAIVAMIFWSR